MSLFHLFTMLCFRSAVKVVVIWIALCALGFPSVCTRREGGSTSIHLFNPFYVGVLAPNIGGSGHFTLLLSDYMRFSFLWHSYCWAWSTVNATKRSLFALVWLYLYYGRGWGACLGFGSSLYLFQQVCARSMFSSELHFTITLFTSRLSTQRLDPVSNTRERGEAFAFNNSIYISLGTTWKKALAVYAGAWLCLYKYQGG